MSDIGRAEAKELLERHHKLIQSIVYRVTSLAGSAVDHDELLACAQEGLLQAARRYDPERGVAFVTYAYYRIRGAVYDGLRRMTPAALGDERLRYDERAGEYLGERSKELPARTATEAAERLSEVMFDLTAAYALAVDGVDEHPDSSTPDPQQVTERREELSLVRKRLQGLPDNERRLLELMYDDGASLQEAAGQLGMSKGWASRLHARALGRLRQAVTDPPPRGRTLLLRL